MMSLQWPLSLDRLTSDFGPRAAVPGVTAASHHDGMDFAAREGDPVPAAGPGTVTRAQRDQFGGMYVCVDHGGGLTSWYWHLSTFAVTVGQRVTVGQIVGGAGATGLASGVHLHYETRVNGRPVNPRTVTTTTTLDLGEYSMIRIQSPGRGIALIGPGYYRHLTTDEEVKQSEQIITRHVDGNDRQFDLWHSMAIGGTTRA